MAQNLLSNRPDYGNTFITSMWLIGLLAVTQVVAVGWAVLSRPVAEVASIDLGQGRMAPSTVPLVVSGASASSEIPASRGQSLPGAGDPGNRKHAHPAEPSGSVDQIAGRSGSASATEGIRFAGGQASTYFGPADAADPTSSGAAAYAERVPPIDNPLLAQLVGTGVDLRRAGNLESALRTFREAEKALPSHPRVMGELATTLDLMGLRAQADEYWKQLPDFGNGVGVGVREFSNDAVISPEANFTVEYGPTMKIGEIKVDENSPTSEGQRVTLRIVIDAAPESSPAGSDLSLLVYFYDLVNDARIEASTADTSYLYPTEPYDWQINGSEEIMVVYNQPIFTEEQRLELGERKYYGYAIELYYRDQLQDRVIMPEEISQLRNGEPNRESGALHTPIGPENALFPNIP
ncbi:MAG: hypothetical protein AAGA96_08255 [Verrucomicrobiota bacterium]